MCIILDVNTLSCVFDQKSPKHQDFRPVLAWIRDGNGVLIYGGSRYLTEIGRGKYLKIFLELATARKAKNIDQKQVDDKEDEVTALIEHPDFDDQHLVALLLVSGCKLICSLDARAYPYFRHLIFFKRDSNRPKIYSRAKNAELLIDKNITEACKPSIKLSSLQKAQISLPK